jgi:hypothetical protein
MTVVPHIADIARRIDVRTAHEGIRRTPLRSGNVMSRALVFGIVQTLID